MPHEDYCYALEQYKSIMDECGEPELPIELFRLFLSLALTGQDWLDVEQVIEGVSEQLAAALDDLEVAKNVANGNVEAKFDAWKQLDVMEHELDAALEACKAKDDIILEVLECESTTRPPIRLREALAIQPDDSTLKDKAMTTYEQPKDWIERHLVEDPGGLLACEPSRLDTLNEELRLARQTNEALRQQVSTLKAELKCIGEAIDDPRTDLTMTMSELILEYKQQLAAALAAIKVKNEAIMEARNWNWLDDDAGNIPVAESIQEALAIQPDDSALKAWLGKPVAWTHSCNVLCLDNVELWIDRCPHCGKPAPKGMK